MAFWLSTCKISSVPPLQISKPFKRKCLEISDLRNYCHPPSSSFWREFPKFRANCIRKRVKSGVFRKLVQKRWFGWTCHQRKIKKIALRTVTRGAQTSLKFLLPGIFSKNAKSAFEHGSLPTDTIAHWVKSEMVAGPFDFPPLENFRVNSLMAVKQKNKVRPILNLSAPKYTSFNDAVDENCICKLEMSSAFLFANALIISHILRRVGATRGGSWNNNPKNCRSANRNRNNADNCNNNIGFRLAVSIF